MQTKFIGTKELRQNMSKITQQAHKNNVRIIVLRKNQPLFELRPLLQKDALAESFLKDIAEGLSDKKNGRVRSQADVEKMFDI